MKIIAINFINACECHLTFFVKIYSGNFLEKMHLA